uniref:Poly [ADP-ribose] polymerase n=1 Tax=Sphaeramia orbicularis TaxID=375764 RepID=A0A673CGQ7_9TELE
MDSHVKVRGSSLSEKHTRTRRLGEAKLRLLWKEIVSKGPSNRVTQVRSRLGPFLDSLRHEKISIDMPGAVRYFRSPSGRDALLKASRDYKCVVQLEENIAGLNLSSLREGTVVASYSLRGGLQVLVCQGDITKLEADVLVNAANEDLDHCGGVAAALSKAGGPQVQKESSRLVQQKGKIRTGEVVMTTGGNLKCKALLHAIGPVQGDVGGREKVLIEQSVKKALDLAETKKFRSIAIPSGLLGCNEIFHASFHCDPQKINKNCKKILKHCESKGYTSVAFPAVNTELPEHWDPMEGEDFKKVELNPNSKEYKEIAQGFLKTAKYNIQKIERIQNLHLWRAFAVCRQRILAKNGVAELGEKLLYHGTSAESCNCIERDKFDRGYAGTHAAAYGKGVYFAVTAEYSARGYSPADSTGLKRLYAARVVTGRYTGGNSTLCAPPARGSDPSDRFDSVVDNQQRPNMFIIFHDGQAYPEYLIIFK